MASYSVAKERLVKIQNVTSLSRLEVCKDTGVSLSVVDDAIRAGHLKSFLIGRRRFTKPEYVRRWITFLEEQSDAGTPIHYRTRGTSVVAAALAEEGRHAVI